MKSSGKHKVDNLFSRNSLRTVPKALDKSKNNEITGVLVSVSVDTQIVGKY